jgi:hypothetical protein
LHPAVNAMEAMAQPAVAAANIRIEILFMIVLSGE